MAEGDSLYKEPIATEQLACSSENLILVDYIKEEPEESEPRVLQLLDVEQPLPPPTPQPSQAQYGPVTHQVWAGVNSVVSPVVLESPLRPATLLVIQRVRLVRVPLPNGKRPTTCTCFMRRQIGKPGSQFWMVA